MKKAFQIFALLMAVVLVSPVMVSCGGDEEEEIEQVTAQSLLTGKWTLSKADVDSPDYYQPVYPEWFTCGKDDAVTYYMNGRTVEGNYLVTEREVIGGILNFRPKDLTDTESFANFEVKELTKNKIVLYTSVEGYISVTLTYKK